MMPQDDSSGSEYVVGMVILPKKIQVVETSVITYPAYGHSSLPVAGEVEEFSPQTSIPAAVEVQFRDVRSQLHVGHERRDDVNTTWVWRTFRPTKTSMKAILLGLACSFVFGLLIETPSLQIESANDPRA